MRGTWKQILCCPFHRYLQEWFFRLCNPQKQRFVKSSIRLTVRQSSSVWIWLKLIIRAGAKEKDSGNGAYFRHNANDFYVKENCLWMDERLVNPNSLITSVSQFSAWEGQYVWRCAKRVVPSLLHSCFIAFIRTLCFFFTFFSRSSFELILSAGCCYTVYYHRWSADKTSVLWQKPFLWFF